MSQQSVEASALAWAAAHPAEMAWLAENMETDEFAGSLARQLGERGRLTTNQEGALRNKVADAKQRDAAPAVNVGEIEARFDVARRRGVKKPMMRLDTFVFKAAGADSRNAGGIYVTAKGDDESTYLGKIIGGRFLRNGLCTPEQEARIVAAAAGPADAARAYGVRTGQCSICGRDLTAEESIDSFVGPRCAEKYGLPWGRAAN